MNYTCATAMPDSDFCYLKMACVLKLQERWKEGKKERKKEKVRLLHRFICQLPRNLKYIHEYFCELLAVSFYLHAWFGVL